MSTSAQYWRGDLVWQALNTSAVSGLSTEYAGLGVANTFTEQQTIVGALKIGDDGQGILARESVADARLGVATLVAGAVTVNTTSVGTTSRILLTAQDNNTTGALRVSARIADTSFTITSSNAGDTGVVAWFILGPGGYAASPPAPSLLLETGYNLKLEDGSFLLLE